MKIMLVCDSMGIGGAETHVLGLAAELCENGHSVTVVAKRGELTERLLCKCKGRAHFIDLGLRGRSPMKLAAYTLALGKLIKKQSPNVIHAHSRPTAFAIRTLFSLRYVKSIPFVVSAHAKYRLNGFARLFSVWGDKCIAVSEDIKNHLIEHFNVAEEKITVIPNGIDTLEFYPRKDYEPYTVLFASRLDDDSSLGAQCLCNIADELAAKYPKVKILIAGGGKQLKELCSSSKNVELLGAQPTLSEVILRAELVIGVSRVALEAMASERNVILFGNEGALGLLYEDCFELAEKTNFTCRDCGIKDERFLLSEIVRFFDADEEKRLEMSKLNRQYAVDRHSEKNSVSKTIELYDQNPRILIAGYYGFGNMGDDAMLCTLVDYLKKTSIRSENICVMAKHEDAFSGIRCVNRCSLIALVREMKKADTFILGGGSLFQNETSNRSLLYYCALVILSKILGCKCILLSNGIGPLKNRLANRIVSTVLKMVDGASFRDSDSLLLARRLGCSEAIMGADLCFSMYENIEESDRVRSIKAKASGGYVMIALKGIGDKQRITKEIKRACGHRAWTPVFVAMDIREDSKTAKRCAELCGGIFVESLGRGELLSLLSDAKIAIGERLHFLIFALLAGKSFVGVGHSPKIVSFVSETMAMPTLDSNYPTDLVALVDKAMAFSHDRLALMLQKYRLRSQRELDELKKAFFV